VTCAGCKEPRGISCHCSRCHQSFASLALFDKHLSVRYGRGAGRTAITCKRPDKMKLVLDVWGTWRSPEGLVAATVRVSKMNTRRVTRRRDTK
jgi:hypothetical protein